MHAWWLAVTLVLAAPSAHAQSDAVDWLLPDYAKLQSGGWLGVATAGLGWELFDDTINASVYYGYVPSSVGGTSVHSVAWQASLRPATVSAFGLSWEPLYVGLGAVYVFGRDFFIGTPSRYPEEDYYPPTGRRLLYSVGTEIRRATTEPLRSHGAFLELTAVDHYLQLWLDEPDRIRWSAALSLSAGYRLAF